MSRELIYRALPAVIRGPLQPCPCVVNLPSSESTEYCERCRRLDFDKILDASGVERDRNEPEKIAELGNPAEFDAYYALCKFFLNILKSICMATRR